MELLGTKHKAACVVLLMGMQIFLSSLGRTQTVSLPEPPQVRAKNHVVSLTLHAVNENGRDTFAFDGANVAPVIRASPGDVIRITYVNDLPAKSSETCAVNPCMDMTNLHFHGLTVSPDAPQDDVLGMLAMPGQILHYSVQIPRDHPPGLFWYHTHPHGESHRQVLDGMSGALVIEGMERYAPEVRRLRERVMVVRGRSIEIENDPNAAELRHEVEIPSKGCGGEAEEVEEIFTVNGTVRPRIEIAPKERQFWRIVNASPDRYLDLQLDGQTFEIVALDGMPLAYRGPDGPTRTDRPLTAVACRTARSDCHRSTLWDTSCSAHALCGYRSGRRPQSGDGARRSDAAQFGPDGSNCRPSKCMLSISARPSTSRSTLND